MNILKQLLRQPLRLTAIVLLLVLTLSFFSLGVGVWASANATIQEVEKSFLTIGIPTNETKREEIKLENGRTSYAETKVLTYEIWTDLLELAEEDSVIEGLYQQRYISACSPQITTVLSAGEGDGELYSHTLDKPYNAAIFVISLTCVEEPDSFPDGRDVFVNITGDILQTVMLHPDYTPRGKLTMYIPFASAEAFEAANLQVGGKYLVYGRNYSDKDLAFRLNLTGALGCSIEEVDYSAISYDPEDLLTSTGEYAKAAVIREESTLYLMSTDPREEIDFCFLSVPSYSADRHPMQLNGTISEVPMSELVCDAVIAPLETDLETFLDSEAGASWREAIRELEVQYHCVTVLGTDLLESMYIFHQKESFLTEGRSFRTSEYDAGAAVCLISESTAQASGLSLGDTIDLSFYWGADPFSVSGVSADSALCAQEYSERVGMTGESRSYEIVGIYRQTDPWEPSAYSLSPNTVLVPAKSIQGAAHTGENGLLTSFVLKNGSIEAFQELMAQRGYPENILLCFDGGYSEIAGTLEDVAGSVRQLLAAACAVCTAGLLVYLTLFVFRQRRNVGLMLSLGSGEGYTVKRIFGLVMLPVLVSSLAGAAVGAALMNTVLQRMFDSAAELLDTAFSGGSAAGHGSLENMVVSLPYMTLEAAVGACVVFAAAAYLCLKTMARKSPLALLRKG